MKVWQFFVLLFVVSVFSVWYTFNYAVEFSAFAVALAKVFIGMFLFYLFDVWALRDIETIQELKNGNIALSIFFLGYAILVAACVATASAGCAPNNVDNHSAGKDPDLVPTDTLANIPHEVHTGERLLTPPPEQPRPLRHLETARQFVGKTEVPKDFNRGPEVDQFLDAVGLLPNKHDVKGPPYCAAFVSFCLNSAGEDIVFPTKRTAAAREFLDNPRGIFLAEDADAFAKFGGGGIRANVVQRGTVDIPPGTLVIWKAKRDPDVQGHVGMVVEWEGQAGTTIEGNTGPGDAGDQRDGGGVYLRKRMLSPGSAFRIVSFTPVAYK